MTVIKVENLGKQYRLGRVGTGTLSHDLNRFWHSIRGKEDPYLKIGDVNKRDEVGNSDLVWALKDINFEVKQGEVLGIIGKNGAGKSTLLKILSQITSPTTGSINIKGRVASLLEVGTGFHPELTGRENIFLNGAILGMKKQEIKNKFDEIVAFSGIEQYIDTPVKRYSSGMYVRLAFAVAAHLEPEILIIDEVLAVGDVEFQKKCLGKMKDVSGQGRTVLFVSHNMAAVKSLCSSLLVLNSGRIAFNGTVALGISNYLTEMNAGENTGMIEQRHRIYNTGNVFFRKVRLRNKEFENGNSIYFNNNLQLHCKVEFLKNIESIFFDARIITSDGIEILHTMNIYNGELKSFKKGSAELNIEIENKLQPGRYFITLGAHQSDGISLDYLENIIEFIVLNVEENSSKGLSCNFKLGYFRPNTVWQITQP